MRAKLSLVAVALVLAGVLAPPAPAGADTRLRVDIESIFRLAEIPVRGTSPSGNFIGTLDLARFAFQDGQLVAVGLLTGRIVDSAGNTVRTVTEHLVTLPLTAGRGSCTILHLELGPVDLDLLGLMVHLDKVVVDITAVQGPGRLLGNLLCAIANLLNNNVGGGALAAVLNDLLRLLN
jgi:hypothetical protein